MHFVQSTWLQKFLKDRTMRPFPSTNRSRRRRTLLHDVTFDFDTNGIQTLFYIQLPDLASVLTCLTWKSSLLILSMAERTARSPTSSTVRTTRKVLLASVVIWLDFPMDLS